MAVQNKILTKIIAEIKTVLGEVDEIAEVKAHGFSKMTKFPAAIFVPETFDNEFLSTNENEETHKFKIWILIGVGEKSLDEIYERILPNAVDGVKEAFNEKWSGSPIDGHRLWYLLDSGLFGLSEEEKALEAWAELTLTVKLATNN